MADQSLDIIIRLRQEGANDQAILDYLQRTGQSAEQAAAALQKFNSEAGKRPVWSPGEIKHIAGAPAAASAADDAELLERGKKLIDDARRAQEEENEVTEQAIPLKQRMREMVKGLAFEFPILARAVGLLTNPISAVITLLGMMAAGWSKAFGDRVEVEALIRQMGELQGKVQSITEAQADAAGDRESFITGLIGKDGELQAITEKLNRFNAELALTLRLTGQGEKADLDLKLAEIDAGPGTAAEKSIAKRAAMAAAKKESEDRATEAEKAKMEATFQAARDKRTEAERLGAQAGGIDIGTLKREKDIADANAGAAKDQFGPLLDQAKKDLDANRASQNQPGARNSPGTMRRLVEIEHELIERYEHLKKTIEDAEKEQEAANEALKKGTADRNAFDSAAKKAREEAQRLEQQGSDKERELFRRSNTDAEVEPKVRRTREIQDDLDRRREAEQLERNNQRGIDRQMREQGFKPDTAALEGATDGLGTATQIIALQSQKIATLREQLAQILEREKNGPRAA